MIARLNPNKHSVLGKDETLKVMLKNYNYGKLVLPFDGWLNTKRDFDEIPDRFDISLLPRADSKYQYSKPNRINLRIDENAVMFSGSQANLLYQVVFNQYNGQVIQSQIVGEKGSVPFYTKIDMPATEEIPGESFVVTAIDRGDGGAQYDGYCLTDKEFSHQTIAFTIANPSGLIGSLKRNAREYIDANSKQPKILTAVLNPNIDSYTTLWEKHNQR